MRIVSIEARHSWIYSTGSSASQATDTPDLEPSAHTLRCQALPISHLSVGPRRSYVMNTEYRNGHEITSDGAVIPNHLRGLPRGFSGGLCVWHVAYEASEAL